MQLAERVVKGLEVHASRLGVTGTPLTGFRSALEQSRNSRAAYATARRAKAVAGQRKIAADTALTLWLGKARLALMLARGARWSESWIEAGFSHRGTNVPKRIEARIALAGAVVAFFARNPEFGVRHANVTAADGRQAHDEIVNARISLHEISAECIASKHARDRAERQLRRSIREVILILRTTIDGADLHWLVSGWSQPNSARTPGFIWAEEAAPMTLLSETKPERAHAAA